MAMPAAKRCRRCGVVKPSGDFYRIYGRFSRPDCKPCVSATNKAAYWRDPDRVREYCRQWRAKRHGKSPVASRACLFCGVAFTPKSLTYDNQKYCSPAHQRQSRLKSPVVRQRDNEARQIRREAAKRLRQPKPPRSGRCVQCGHWFVTIRPTRKFCTIRCRNQNVWQRLKRGVNAGRRRQYQRNYRQRCRERGRTLYYALSDSQRARKRSYLRAYYHSHKDEYRVRKKEWFKTPKGRACQRAFRLRKLTRNMTPNQREIYLTLHDFRKWCQERGHRGYRDFLNTFA